MANDDDWKSWGKHVLAELERLNESQRDIGQTLNKNTDQLSEHMRRTAIAEETLNILKKEFESKIGPIESHVNMMTVLFKSVAFILSTPIVYLAIKALLNQVKP